MRIGKNILSTTTAVKSGYTSYPSGSIGFCQGAIFKALRTEWNNVEPWCLIPAVGSIEIIPRGTFYLFTASVENDPPALQMILNYQLWLGLRHAFRTGMTVKCIGWKQIDTIPTFSRERKPASPPSPFRAGQVRHGTSSKTDILPEAPRNDDNGVASRNPYRETILQLSSKIPRNHCRICVSEGWPPKFDERSPAYGLLAIMNERSTGAGLCWNRCKVVIFKTKESIDCLFQRFLHIYKQGGRQLLYSSQDVKDTL